MCTLNVLIAQNRGKEFPFTQDILEAFIAAYTVDYQSNSHGCGTFNGVEVTSDFGWVPAYLEQGLSVCSPIYLAHTRLATCAKNKHQSLQPFEFGNYICMHNGVISFNSSVDMTTYSDSWHYFKFITDLLEVGMDIKEAIEAVAKEQITYFSRYSCFLYDKETGDSYYWVNGASMHLYEDDDCVWLATRDQEKYLGVKMEPIADMQLYRFAYNEKDELEYTWERFKHGKKETLASRDYRDYDGYDDWSNRRRVPKMLTEQAAFDIEEISVQGKTAGGFDDIVVRGIKL